MIKKMRIPRKLKKYLKKREKFYTETFKEVSIKQLNHDIELLNKYGIVSCKWIDNLKPRIWQAQLDLLEEVLEHKEDINWLESMFPGAPKPKEGETFLEWCYRTRHS